MEGEELLILRLPPRLAARIGARIDKFERSRGDAAAILRRRRKKNKQGKTDTQQTLALIQAIWGEDGILDYDSLERAEDLLYLDDVDQSGYAEEDDKDDKDSDTEEVDDGGDCEVDYWKVEGRDYIFRYGEDEYYATLVSLPCVIEAQKSIDNINVYKTADVNQMLLVQDVKASSGLPRPAIDSQDMYDGIYAHGLTPPMRRVGPDRYAKVNPQVRMAEERLGIDDVRRADNLLFDYKEMLLHKNKRTETPAANKPGPKSKKVTPGIASTVFVYEEVITAEPWMEFADDVIVIEQRDDNFRSSTREARNKALENKALQDEKKKASLYPPTASSNSGSVADAVAQFRTGSINWNPPPSVPSISLSAPPLSLAGPPMPAPVSSVSLAAPPILAPPSVTTKPAIPVDEPLESESRETYLNRRISEMEAEIATLPPPMRARYAQEIQDMKSELQDFHNML